MRYNKIKGQLKMSKFKCQLNAKKEEIKQSKITGHAHVFIYGATDGLALML